MGQYYEAAFVINENYQIIINKIRQMTKLVQNMKLVSVYANNKLNP